MIEIAKQLFVHDLEQGKDVVVPEKLSQQKLSLSFKYYDSVVHYV